ncbi:hypothetical protein [Pedobacter antarcticus]|uniref:hypothetical protein n=1 Tax=Pedobacter antarcticus TaxID=34086 RepID=UPI001C55A5E5|nr:hypothetical protein [Pedobacter antarcticus]
MKFSIRILVLSLIIFSGFKTYAFQNDTSAYQTQRQKINMLLAERSARFGQYDLSLSARSGIFGLQTKNDLKNSNEILRNIILNDNNIFRELKVLMNYKDQEVSQVQSNEANSRKRIDAYMQTIKKLQDENETLRHNVDETDKKTGTFTLINIILGALFLAALIYIFTLHKKINTINNLKT